MTPVPGASYVSYMDTEIYDYPSVGQIATALREEGIIPIFAATFDTLNIYSVSIASHIHNSILFPYSSHTFFPHNFFSSLSDSYLSTSSIEICDV